MKKLATLLLFILTMGLTACSSDKVSFTVPADYIGDATQDELTKTATERGYEAIKLNDDGSATYTMTSAQQAELLSKTKEAITASVKDMVGSTDYPNITDITINDTVTEFKVTTTSKELDVSESFISYILYAYGGMYAAYNGTADATIYVEFYNAESGETIFTGNSSEVGSDK